jgi:hypothetical protein
VLLQLNPLFLIRVSSGDLLWGLVMEAARSSVTLCFFYLFFFVFFVFTRLYKTLQDLKDLPTPNNKNFILVCAQKVSFVLFFIEKLVSNFVSDGLIFQYGFFYVVQIPAAIGIDTANQNGKLPCTLYV